jgi:hypothetical protein
MLVLEIVLAVQVTAINAQLQDAQVAMMDTLPLV